MQVQRPPEEMDTTTPESQTEPSKEMFGFSNVFLKIFHYFVTEFSSFNGF